MAQISLSWHRLGEIREERELCSVAGDSDPEMKGASNRDTQTRSRKFIVDYDSIMIYDYLIL